MHWTLFSVTCLLGASSLVLGCEVCEDAQPGRDVVMTRHVRRMQPDATKANSYPKGPLAWGQVNFLHTTDTHGWLEGHLKEQNYGADWGDFVSFMDGMKQKAKTLDVDLLLVDTGDLHDGAGLSDATSLNGELSNPIFQNIRYDLLSIGNHELYYNDVAYETQTRFARHYGTHYLTSNVQIMNPSTGAWEYIGQQFRHFTTPHGLDVVAFGVLYDFKGNSNATRVIPAKDMINSTWFQKAIRQRKPVDLFILIGHNPVRPTVSSSTLDDVYAAIRAANPDTPIQVFGGHTHIRDFAVYDEKATALESGRYCETLGFLSMSGFNTSRFQGPANPTGVSNPVQPAVNVNNGTANPNSPSPFRYFRRYLDWNRLTFEYHANGSQAAASGKVPKFDSAKGASVSKNITETRKQLNLTALYGCAPQTWCISCAPFGSPNNIFTVLTKALQATVINDTRKDIPRMILSNTGSIRFDLPEGPFTRDDSYIVSPFKDAFKYLSDVPFAQANSVLAALNAGAYLKKRSLESADFDFYNPSLPERDLCQDLAAEEGIHKRNVGGTRFIRRQAQEPTPGYVTTDDFGNDGDDTTHKAIPFYRQPNAYQANASFPTDGSTPQTVDLIFLDFIAQAVVTALNKVGGNYQVSQAEYYLPPTFTTNTFLTQYAKSAADWQKDVPNCPVGLGIGY